MRRTRGWLAARMLIVLSVVAGAIGSPAGQAQAATPKFVQVNSSVPQSAVTTVAVKYKAAQTAGNLNVVIVGWNDTTASVTSVTDTMGNTYVRAIGPTVGTGLTQSIYYATPIAAAAANANTVTVKFSPAAHFPDVRILEYSGIDTAVPVDGAVGNKGNSDMSDSGPLSTANASDLLVAGNMVATSASAGTGFTLRVRTSPDGDIAEDRIVTAAGTYNATAPLGSGQWVMQMVAFRAGGSTPPPPPPTAPTTLTATAVSSSQINLSWTASTGSVTNYRVERCQGAGCTTFAQIGTPTATTFADTGLTASTTYSYRVLASGPGGVSGYSNTATATTQAVAPPTAPTNLNATAVSNSQVTLSWTASTGGGGVTGYRVERCQGAGCSTFTQVGTPTGTTFNDTGLAASTAYAYRVRADSPGGLSDYSAVASATTPAATPPTAPSNLSATAASGSQINLSWTAPTGGGSVSNYRVERCQGASCSTFAQIATPTGTTYNDTGLLASTAYAYRVRAEGPGGLSDYSNTASATTLAQAPATPAFVQVNAAVPNAVSVVTAKFNAAQKAGDLNVVIVGWNDTTSSVTSISDTFGNTYIRAIGPTVGTGLTQSIYYATPIAAAAAGANTVTVTFNQPASFPDVRILEYSGIDARVAIDGAVGASGNSALSDSGPLTTTNANDLLVAGNMVATASSAGTGFTLRIRTNPDSDIAEDRIATATGTYNATASLDSGQWVMQLVAFRAAGSPVPPGPPSVSLTAPVDGVRVVGSVTVSAVAAGSSPIAGVQFKVDGNPIGVEVTASPYQITWDSSTVTPGVTHVLTAVARDIDGRTATSAPVTVLVEAPSTIGQWQAPVSLPVVAVHSLLLPDGKVMLFDGQDFGVVARLWDLATNTFRAVDPPINMFCAGLTSLADGSIFSAGGHQGTAHVGLNNTNIFNFLAAQWNVGPTMASGRWYPTTTTLPDGRVLILAGESTCDQCNVLRPEIYDPSTNGLIQLTGAEKNFSYYPHTFVLPDGRILVSSSAEYPTLSQVLDLNTKQWTPIGSTALDGGTAVMYRPGKILKAGTSTDPDKAVRDSAATAYVLDMNQPSPAWRQVANMAFPRTYATSVMLPDGNVFVEGGGRTTEPLDPTGAVYDTEIWSPTTETWRTTAPLSTPRLYHSNALLLPDGRVMVAGGGRFNNGNAPTDRLSAEFYQPPYLFKGPRPTITSAPANVHYGQGFHVQTADAAQIASVALIRLGSATHAFDMSQRYVPLGFSVAGDGLDVQAVANGNLAPPGYYMLFIVNGNGVPSVAAIVQVTS